MRQTSTIEKKTGLTGRHPVSQGSVSVEMALVTPLLLVLLFGIIEFGLIFKDVAILKQAAREGSRTASVGASTTEITDRVTASGTTIDVANLAIDLRYRVYSGGWPSWDSAATLGDIGTSGVMQNNAPVGSQIRVQVAYPHHLISGRLFSRMADEADGETMTLTTSSTMRRE